MKIETKTLQPGKFDGLAERAFAYWDSQLTAQQKIKNAIATKNPTHWRELREVKP